MGVDVFDFFGNCLVKVPFFSIILDFAVELILDSDCVFKVLSFFTSSGSFTANENQTAIGTVAASDADGDTVAYSLSGTDADSLEINSSTGVLTFKTAPTY